MHLTEISLNDKAQWYNELAQMRTFDIYHTFLYNSLTGNNVQDSRLLSFSEGKYKICFPIIMRKIKSSSFNDVTSVYGYAGLLSNNKFIPSEIKSDFKKMLSDYFFEKKVITAFSRLHPLIPESTDFPEGMGMTEDVNTTVFIDLSLSIEKQLKQYSCSLKRQIIQIKNEGVSVRVAERSDIDTFISLYYATMNRLNAKEEYYFSKDYFYRLVESPDFKTFILLADYNGSAIAGGLFTCCNGFMQYHLGAVLEEFLYLSPLKVIIDEARKTGVRENMKYLHLGGGYDGQNSGLFDFKSRFSKERAVFKVWKWIFDQTEYDLLVKERFGNDIPGTSYFPLYRY